MVLNYVLVSCVMSLSIVALLSVFACRGKNVKNRADIFSASLGIIIFVCVKSIFVDCGWGFAAFFGVLSGFAAQLAMTLGAFVFFRELRGSDFLGKGSNMARNIALLCFGIGRNLMCDTATVADFSLYLLGEATEFAVIITAGLLLYQEEEGRGAADLTGTAAAILIMKAVACVILRRRAVFDGEFAGLVLLTLGISGLVCEFVGAVRQERAVSAGGFAAGFTAALCVTTLLG